MKKSTLWIAKTALMIALLLILQFSTASLGQYVTGSCVNFILAMSVFIGGFSSGTVVALLSPFFAFLLGIGPMFITLVPCIALGNFVFVLILSLLWKNRIGEKGKLWLAILVVILAALVKFGVLYILVVKLVLPSLGLPDAKLAIMSIMFSYPQLVTAVIGGVLASVLSMRLASSKLKQFFASSN